MKYSSTFKRRLLSGTVLVLSAALVAGCGFIGGHAIDDIFGETRTVPDNDTVDFANRHTPILNPSTNRPATASSLGFTPSGTDMSAPAPMSAPMPVSAPAPMSAPAAAPAPQSMMVPSSSYSNVASSSGRRMPVENETILAGNAPASMSAPIAPVMASNTTDASATVSAVSIAPQSQPQPAQVETAVAPSESAPAVTADASPVMPVAMPKPAEKSFKVASENDIPAPVASGDIDLSGSSKYPALASVPPAPAVPSTDQSAAQLNSMVSDQGKSEASRQQLMNNPAATVMTSPQTGQVVGNAATATVPVAPAGSSDVSAVTTPAAPVSPMASVSPAPDQPRSGFNSWLHNLFHNNSASTASSDSNNAMPVAPNPLDAGTSASAAMANSPRDLMMVPGGAANAAPADVTATSSGTEVAPNVILGNAPAFPAPSPASAPVIAQPVPDTNAASAPVAVQPADTAIAIPPAGISPAPDSSMASAPVAVQPADTAIAIPPAGISPAPDSNVASAPVAVQPAPDSPAPAAMASAPAATPAAPASADSFAQPMSSASLATVPPVAADAAPASVGTTLPQPTADAMPAASSSAPVAVMPQSATPPFAMDTSQPSSATPPSSSVSAPLPVTTPLTASVPAPVLSTSQAAAPVTVPTASASVSTPPAAADASAQQPPAMAAVPAATDLDTVHLTPPPSATASASGLPDVSQISGATETPVNLAPPSEVGSQHFLSDSRYMDRHGQSDSNN